MLNFPRWKQLTILGICLAGFLVVLPNFVSEQTLNRWPGWLPRWQLSLGLDLRGGAHLLYAMETNDVRRDWLDALRDEARQRLKEAKVPVPAGAVGIAGNSVVVRPPKAEDIDAAYKALQQLIQPLGNPLMGGTGNSVDVTKDAKGVTITPTEAGLSNRIGGAVDAAIETVRRRVDAIGTKEPHIVREGEGRILVQVPGLQDTAELERLIGETARLSFHEVHASLSPAEAKGGRTPLGFKIFQGIDKREGDEYLLRETPVVRGEELNDASPGFHQQTGLPIVEFGFNNSGARKFGKFTRDHVGKPFAIVLDDKVISAPEIRSAIEGGRGYIEGNFTPETSTKLAIQLKSGALPAKLTIVEKRTVGPSLGSDSIEAGKLAGIIGGIATIILTILYYGTFGIFACMGLLVHGVLTVALMSLFGSALTLPGIAGLVLGIAMAVDANVLIYERIREEVRNGKSPVAAVDSGFGRAYVTILDSQLTTLSCALVMFWLGSGPIRGFAVTLTIGILTSIFASVTVVRLLIYYWLNAQPRIKGKPLTLPV
jgi:preprotein translocase subunit SecD